MKRGHKRGAGSSTLPHHYPSRIKKQGGTQQHPDNTGSMEELRSGEMSPKHPGWKTKLGSLLKKGHGSSVQRQASLRRCQSDDSLASHGSQQKLSQGKRPNFHETTLSHAVSLEGHGVLDSHVSDPQTSPAVMRHSAVDGNKENDSRKRNPRPTGGIYTRKISGVRTGGHSFQPTFLPLKTKPNEANTEAIRSCSPFSGLASDFSNVMDERGLDFDPLNYRSSVNLRARSPVEEKEETTSADAMVTVKRVASLQSLHGEAMFAAVSSAKPLTSQNKNNNRVAPTTRSNQLEDLTSESIGFENSGSKSERLFKKPSTFARDQLLKRRSLKENVRNREKSNASGLKPSRNIDSLTADDCVAVSESSRKQTKLSAAELLGVSPRKLSPDREKDLKSKKAETDNSSNCQEVYKSTSDGGDTAAVLNNEDNDLRLDLNENFKCMDLKEREQATTLSKDASLDFTTSNKRYSVQCYSIPEEKGLQKKSHYGSFIALVGLKSDEGQHFSNQDDSTRNYKLSKTYSENYTSTSRTNSFKQPKPSSQWRQPNVNKVYNIPYQHSHSQHHDNHMNYPNGHRQQNYISDISCQNSHSKKLIGYERDKEYCDSRATHKQSAHPCTIYTPTLDTFNPEGKQRQDYINLTPPKHDFNLIPSSSYENQKKPFHNRSLSVDSYPSNNKPQQGPVLPQQHHSVTTQHHNGTTFHPLPVPRKHGRSLSAGDDSESPNVPEFGRPIPLPRRLSKSSPHGGYPPPVSYNHERRNQRRMSEPSHPLPFQSNPSYSPNSVYPPTNCPPSSYHNARTSYSNKTYEYVENVEQFSQKTNYYHEQQNSYPPRRKLFHQSQLERRAINKDFSDSNSYPPRSHDNVTSPHDVIQPYDVIQPSRDFHNAPYRSHESYTPSRDGNYPPHDVMHHTYDVTPRRKQQRASYAEGTPSSDQHLQHSSNNSRGRIAPVSYFQHETYARHVTPAQDFSTNQGLPCSSLSWV